MNVSTGEPSDKWKAWVKWLRLLAVVLAGTWLLRYSRQDLAILFALVVVLAMMCHRLRLTEQRFDLLIDQHLVQLNLYTDMSRRVWIESKSQDAVVRSCIRERYAEGWLDYDIALNGRQYQLRIFVKPFGSGYMVSNYGRGFDMVVVRNSCCF